MLIAYMKEEAPDVLTGKEGTDLTHLVRWYKDSKKKFDEDPDFKKRSQLEVVALQREPALARLGDHLRYFRKAYQEIYDLFHVRLIERGESFYNPMWPIG